MSSLPQMSLLSRITDLHCHTRTLSLTGAWNEPSIDGSRHHHVCVYHLHRLWWDWSPILEPQTWLHLLHTFCWLVDVVVVRTACFRWYRFSTCAAVCACSNSIIPSLQSCLQLDLFWFEGVKVSGLNPHSFKCDFRLSLYRFTTRNV